MKNAIAILLLLIASLYAHAEGDSITKVMKTNTSCTTTCTTTKQEAPTMQPMSAAFGTPTTVYTAKVDDPTAAPVPIAPTKPTTKFGNGPDEVSTDNLDKPHKDLKGNDLKAWNQFCAGRIAAAVGEWRSNKCKSLDPAF